MGCSALTVFEVFYLAFMTIYQKNKSKNRIEEISLNPHQELKQEISKLQQQMQKLNNRFEKLSIEMEMNNERTQRSITDILGKISYSESIKSDEF